jgi:hypothetical protein
MEMLNSSQVAALKGVQQRLAPDLLNRVLTASVEGVYPVQASASHWNFDLPSHAADEALGPDASDAMRRALIATWVLEMGDRVEQAKLPVEVLELYPFWLDKLVGFLSEAAGTGADYDTDHYAKDVRLSLVLSVPGSRTQTLDLSSPMGPGQVVRNGRDGYGWSQAVAYVKAQGWKKAWLQTHTEGRHTEDFNEAGWDRLWTSAAAVCVSRPELAGVIGSSWFFDPPLETISPRLAYLRINPLKGGAFIIHQGPGQGHSDRCGATSPTRRAMIESGEYLPRSWLIAWPRTALIAWAKARGIEANGQKAA